MGNHNAADPNKNAVLFAHSVVWFVDTVKVLVSLQLVPPVCAAVAGRERGRFHGVHARGAGEGQEGRSEATFNSALADAMGCRL